MVEKEIVLPVERERAWELLTEEPEEWLADAVELDPEPGAPLRVAWDDGAERTGVVEEVEPGRRLAFRWHDDATGIPSRVEWTLDDAPGGTRVRVVEAPLAASVHLSASHAHKCTLGAGRWAAAATALARAAALLPA